MLTVRDPRPPRKPCLSREEFEKWLRYEPDTGFFFRAVDSTGARKAGERITNAGRDGYLRIIIKGTQYQGHRVAWIMAGRGEPPAIIDHINGDRTDNRIENLRAADAQLNVVNSRKRANCSSSLKGITRHNSGRWQAAIKFHGKYHHLGMFADEASAHQAYMDAATSFYGEFARAS